MAERVYMATTSAKQIDDDFVRSVQEGLERILEELLKEEK